MLFDNYSSGGSFDALCTNVEIPKSLHGNLLAVRFCHLPMQEDELNLKAFACKTVNVSFSVATRNRGFSGYSPPQSVEVGMLYSDIIKPHRNLSPSNVLS